MAPPIRIRTSFPLSQSLPSGSFHKPLILLHQRADRLKTTITENYSRPEYWSGLPFPSPGGSSQPGNQTQVFCIASRRFNLWATREAPYGPQPCLTQWNYEPCCVWPPKTDGSWWRVLTKCGLLEKGWQTTSVFLPWEPHEQYEKAKR